MRKNPAPSVQDSGSSELMECIATLQGNWVLIEAEVEEIKRDIAALVRLLGVDIDFIFYR
jgi:hypothetical protein